MQRSFVEFLPFAMQRELQITNQDLAKQDQVIMIGERLHSVFTRALSNGSVRQFIEPLK